VEVYDPLLDEWTPGPGMGEARSKHGAVTHEGKIFAVGGRYGHRPSQLLSTAEFLEPSARQGWQTVPGSMASVSGAVRVTIVEEPPPPPPFPSFSGGD